MKSKYNPTDNLFRKATNLDNPSISPDPSTIERLNYYYSLKQPMRKLHANSFSGMFLWLFSIKGVGVKAGFVSVCLTYFLFMGNIKNNPGLPETSDTCQIRSLLVDTSYVVKDTCR